LSGLSLIGLGLVLGASGPTQELQLADLGECELESGEVITGCVVGYRTAGTLNEDASNVVLFPAWGGGTSEQLLMGGYVGVDGWVSPNEYFVVMVDPFGNGVSSSPSNSLEQPGPAFPVFTVRDIVRAQHRLVTEVLELDRLHAVVGISMGASVAFEWTTSFPGFVANAIPVVGTPQVSPYDLLRNDLARRILEACEPERCDEAREAYLSSFRVFARTPGHRNRTLARADVPAFLASIPGAARNLPATEDILSQGRALDRMDITEPFGGSMEQAAEVVESRMLIVVATYDALVTTESSRQFARLTGAELVELDSDCGHQAFVCEREVLGQMIRDFLR